MTSRFTKLYADLGLASKTSRTNLLNVSKRGRVVFSNVRSKTSHGSLGLTSAVSRTVLSPGYKFSNTVRWYSTGVEKTVVVPPMGDSISEGRIISWGKKVGEHANVDDVICSLETDKITVDVRATEAGVIRKTFAEEGQDVRVGQPLFAFEAGAAGSAAPKAEAPKAEAPKTEAPKAEAPKAEAPKTEAPKASSAPKEATKPAPSKAVEHASQPGSREEKRVPMSKMRMRIAERLKASQNTNAMLTTFNEIDMHNIMELRNKYKDAFAKKHDVKLGFMSAFVKAASIALKELPQVNAVIDGDQIVYRDYHDIGVAVATPTGLVVPILRNVETMGFAQIEKTINDYGKKARDGKITMEDMAGGTFTISNGGVFGSLFGTPIINPPQSAVLGMHAINNRPHVVGNEIKIRPIMFVALTYDHRLIDGREAVTFLKKIKECIEDPQTILLDL
eukprot:TRINITY_DN763_c0_g1_i1.p1 TRINITY_DN763_c0_g1~~TRINITY_DN763_c0_g1_i1.p1  ORF type:complete len:448 (+),score=123.49 TRINITY_DN763_c0_g1_i1:583-1926(+)